MQGVFGIHELLKIPNNFGIRIFFNLKAKFCCSYLKVLE